MHLVEKAIFPDMANGWIRSRFGIRTKKDGQRTVF